MLLIFNLVGDGKCDIAPLKRKIQPLKIKELSIHPEDKQVLKQGSKHADRVFIQKKAERDVLTNVLTGKMPLKDFLNLDSSSFSRNFQINNNIILKFKDESEISNCYIELLSEACKNIAVAGILQFQ